jgi:hypothetical protein
MVKSVLSEEFRAGIKMFAVFPAATVLAQFANESKLMAYPPAFCEEIIWVAEEISSAYYSISLTSLTFHDFVPAVVLVKDVVIPSLLFAKVISTRRSPADMAPVGKYLFCMHPMIPNRSGIA